jgi:hypothetical protein
MPNSRYEHNTPLDVACCLLGSLDLSLYLRSYRQGTAESCGDIISHRSGPLVCIRVTKKDLCFSTAWSEIQLQFVSLKY